jgi:hypothetical protein
MRPQDARHWPFPRRRSSDQPPLQYQYPFAAHLSPTSQSPASQSPARPRLERASAPGRRQRSSKVPQRPTHAISC